MNRPDPLIAAATHALDGSPVRVRPGGDHPHWGCSLIAHEILGWCASDTGITATAECMAWRIHAGGYPVPDGVWARAVSAVAAG